MEEGRPQSFGEEIANAVSHGAGLVGSLIALPLLVLTALRRQHDTSLVVAFTIYGVTLAMLYGASTVYHALPAAADRAKQLWRTLDHGAIYLLIAGTYTPFTLITLRGRLGWTIFGIIWSLAAVGVLKDAIFPGRYRAVSVVLYLLMGWLIVAATPPLRAALPSDGVFWLTAGGIIYTAGIVFYAMGKRVAYTHGVWHLFALGGSICHYVAVVKYVA